MTDLPTAIRYARMKIDFNIKGRLLFERGKISASKDKAGMPGVRERGLQHVLGEGQDLPRGVLRFVRSRSDKDKTT